MAPHGARGRKQNRINQKGESLATSVEAPMVGKILRIEKQAGDHVDEDEVVIVMEAMKMEIPIVAPVAGTLKEIMVSPGQAVEAEQALAVIE
jgi:biotin carboxyl carrier protein